MDRQRLLAFTLFSLLGIGCSESGTPISPTGVPLSDGVPAAAAGINGPHTGEVWIARNLGTERFNLQTGVKTEVSSGVALPTRDGRLYLEYLSDNGIIQHDNCPISPSYYDAQVLSVIDSRTSAVLSSFTLGTDVIGSSLRLSPDGERIAMYVAEDTQLCDENDSNPRFSVYSKEGKQLYRKTDGHFAAYDWHPDGRLVVLRGLPETDFGFVMQIETNPGSYELEDLFVFNAPPDVIRYRGLRVGSTGEDAVLEAVTQDPTSLAGVFYRNAKAHHFPLFAGADIGETDLFEHSGARARVNGVTFSPDGKHLLVTEGYSSGSSVFFQHYPALDVLDGPNSLAVVPYSGDSASYIVPVDVKEQPMPPVQYSENIRPVIADQGTRRGIVGFYPLYSLTWTPVVN